MPHFARGLSKHAPAPNVNNLIAPLSGLGPFEPAPHLAAALSGGADSMALALLAHEWVQARGGTLTTLTVNHGLRPESAAEATQAGAWMAQHGIAHHILTPEYKTGENNLSAAARNWRYDALTCWCRAHHVLHLLVAHHQNDQAETARLMQARGNTTDGVAAMPWVRAHAGVRVLRPLLAIPRDALRDYLRARNHPWVEDPTNTDPRFARTRMRTALTAAPDTETQALAQQAESAQLRADMDDAHAAACYGCITLNMAKHTASITMQAFAKLPENVACRLLADMLRSMRGRITRPRKAETLRLYRGLLAGEPHHTLYGFKITLCADKSVAHIAPEGKTHTNSPANALPIAPARFWA